MAKKKKKIKEIKEPKRESKKEIKEKWHSHIGDETKHSILAITFFVLASFFTLSYFNKAGVLGTYAYKILDILFGAGFFLVPVVLFLITISFLRTVKPSILTITFVGAILFLLSSLGITDVVFGEKVAGYVGYFVSLPILKLFDFWVSLIFLIAIFIISLLLMLNASLSSLFKKKEEEYYEDEEENEDEENGKFQSVKDIINELKEVAQKEITLGSFGKTNTAEAEENKDAKIDDKKGKKIKDEDELEVLHNRMKGNKPYSPPPIDILETSKGKPSSGDIKANSNLIKRTLQNFGIDVEMGEVNVGPSVTQYTLKPAEGIKLSKILTLQNDLSLALAAHPIRIEAPIPGKSLVGIEIPNTTKTLVGLADLFSEDEFKNSPKSLLLTLGRDTSGKTLFASLAKMPHLLIAGATGTGKSITIHTLIMSLLYQNSPEMLRFIMIDPKRVELTTYNKIPHLLTPVIIDSKKAIMALKWATKEMDRRYNVLLKSGVRDISSYHKNIVPKLNQEDEDYEIMPNIVIIIDELADLMSSYPREVEASIVRLAQMSRAVGIHLVVSTQRPSVEVITGLIKANITSRIALQVASQIDSRTILDMSGAEKLLGNGDMLYLSGDIGKPKRVQGPFITEKEIKKVVDYLADNCENDDLESLNNIEEEIFGDEAGGGGGSGSDSNDDYDNLYEEARDMVIKNGKASTSYLQRKFKIGYSRAARIIDMLEDRGVVGPSDGAKPRDVFIKNEDGSAEFYKENKGEF